MKRVILATLFASTLLVAGRSTAHATEVGTARRFGVGFAIGDPTSIVGKYFLDPSNALDFGVSFFRRGYGGCYYYTDNGRRRGCNYGFHALGLSADYLWQQNLARGTAKLDWHIGIGGRLWVNDDDYYDDDLGLGARVPVGLDLTFDNPRFLEVFLELAPILYVIPTDFNIEVQLGVRFYF